MWLFSSLDSRGERIHLSYLSMYFIKVFGNKDIVLLVIVNRVQKNPTNILLGRLLRAEIEIFTFA